MKMPSRIIKHPLLTEKSTGLKDINWYVFTVDRKANKREIKQAIEDMFGVKVESVNTNITRGKVVKRGGKPVGRKSAMKKAFIKLKEGSFDFFEGV
ncbi:MAG: 50S ribosomal protein L23 [Candidatus Dadabacteria bacterium]|nr:50S ribosomal protein L23 [Candidatus Dadabacteria bacterium]